MNASEWEASCNALEMLAAVRDRGASPRKFRLFGLACCRRRDDLIQDHRCRDALRLIERLAEGDRSAGREVEPLRDELEEMRLGRTSEGAAVSADDARVAAALLALLGDDDSMHEAAYRVAVNRGTGRSAYKAHPKLLREVMGNPFRPAPAIDPNWLAWERGLAEHLARTAYDGRAYDRLRILADALEDAGCGHAELLAHLRGPADGHVLGCWALDVLLGKA
jgi:hypothetical protein